MNTIRGAKIETGTVMIALLNHVANILINEEMVSNEDILAVLETGIKMTLKTDDLKKMDIAILNAALGTMPTNFGGEYKEKEVEIEKCELCISIESHGNASIVVCPSCGLELTYDEGEQEIVLTRV